MPTNPDRAPNCVQCVHFRITWDPDFPRACNLFNIKTRSMPSYEVFAANKLHCPSFQRKPGLQ